VLSRDQIIGRGRDAHRRLGNPSRGVWCNDEQIDAAAVVAHRGQQRGGLAREVAQPQYPVGHAEAPGAAVPARSAKDQISHRPAKVSIARVASYRRRHASESVVV
jgi:hypothetical protein